MIHRTGLSLMLLICSLPCFCQDLNRFAGLHFDFHASLQDSGIGATMTRDMIDSLLEKVKPDFLQVDCKGHPGITSYPTQIGTHAPGIKKDILQIFRDETAKYHVPLYIHYSGVWDYEAIKKHPGWARINADGKPDAQATSVFGPYSDSLMIPQLREIFEKYKIDGAWIDGDCWTLQPDYAPAAMAAFKKESGLDSVPVKTTDPNYYQWAEFNRKGFRNYVAHYIDAVHQAYPSAHITSNWSFSSFMPEKVSIPVDFLSGDVAGANSLYSSAFESRCMALQGKPWDLMSWSFTFKEGIKATRSVPQIEQQAAEVLAMGGGYQTYWMQNRDGSPETQNFSTMAQIVKFCHDRKSFCFGGRPVPQIGLLYSAYSWRHMGHESLYNGSGLSAIKSILNMLLDSQLPVEVLMDHQLIGRLKEYPLIVIPEWTSLDTMVRKQLTDYVSDGGHLLIIGADATAGFQHELGSVFSGAVTDTGFVASYKNKTVFIRTRIQPFKSNAGKLFGQTLRQDDPRFSSGLPLASVSDYGKGSMGALYLNVAAFYDANQVPVIRELVSDLATQLMPDPMLTVSGDEHVHAVLTKKNNKLYVHLINTNGPHDNARVMVYDEVPPLRKLTVSMRLNRKPAQVLLQPGNRSVPFSYKNGHVALQIGKMDIYEIVEILE